MDQRRFPADVKVEEQIHISEERKETKTMLDLIP